MNKINYNWHLPSKKILNAMYKNKEIGGFVGADYWSSSEGIAKIAWYQDFFNGVQYYYNKGYGFERARAVRALPEDHNETERIFKVKDWEYQAYRKDSPKEMNWEEAMEYCEELNE